MKKLTLLFIALMALAQAYSQKIFPTPADHPFWIEEHGVLWGNCGCGCTNYYFCDCSNPVYYKSDTVISGETYNCYYTYGVCTATYTGGIPPPPPCQYTCSYLNPETLFAMIRQDTITQQVFLYDGSTEYLLYDFSNMLVGQVYPQTYSNNHYPDLIIVSEDSLLLNGTYYKRWGLGLNNGGTITDSNYLYIIKGIGSTFGIRPAIYDPPFENYDFLSCFSLDNIVIYPDSAYNCDQTVNVQENQNAGNSIIYPNPSDERLTVEIAEVNRGCILKVYNAAGKELIQQKIHELRSEVNLTNFPGGIYFVKLYNDRMIEIRKIIIN